MTQLTGLQIRAARALLRITAAELAELSRIGAATVRRAELEDGPVSMTAANAFAVRQALEKAGVRFIDAEEDITGPGVALKWGAKLPHSSNAAPEHARIDGNDGLEALDWDVHDPDVSRKKHAATSLDWDDDVKAGQVAHWRARPEEWAALAETSRQCLLRAMGINQLWSD